MMELAAIAKEHGGIIQTNVAAQHGISKAMLYKLCKEDRIQRIVKSMLGYANQLPYRETTPVRPMQWSASYPAYQDNFVNYWSAPAQSAVQSGAPMPNQEELRRVFHSAVDCTAQLTKENAPVPSIIFDGLGLLTAENLFEAAKSALSIIDTAKKLML